MWIAALHQQWKTMIRIAGYRCEPAFGVRTWQTTHNTLSTLNTQSLIWCPQIQYCSGKKITHVFSRQIARFLINHCSNLSSQLTLVCSHKHQSHAILIIIIFNFVHNVSYYVIFLISDALCFYRLQVERWYKSGVVFRLWWIQGFLNSSLFWGLCIAPLRFI